MVLHLGDVYYSGTKTEMQQRFLQVWPKSAGKISRALNGNHEMYSGGYEFFDHVLPSFGQSSSYFALQNNNWLFVGLDTAHTDHDLDAQQVSWLKAVVQQAGARKLILFSHHQPFSRLDAQGPKLQAALADLLPSKSITAWYWGHEHNCIMLQCHTISGCSGVVSGMVGSRPRASRRSPMLLLCGRCTTSLGRGWRQGPKHRPAWCSTGRIRSFRERRTSSGRTVT